MPRPRHLDSNCQKNLLFEYFKVPHLCRLIRLSLIGYMGIKEYDWRCHVVVETLVSVLERQISSVANFKQYISTKELYHL